MPERRVRVYLGTHKGTYVLESATARRRWKVRGPYHTGNPVYHAVADPRREGDVYAAVNNPFWGPMLFRSNDFGRHWKEIAPPMMTLRKDRKPRFGPDAAAGPIVNIWHVKPGPPNEPKSLFVGVDPGSLYRSDDRGASWSPVNGINQHPTRPKWNPGAGGLCLHTILIDPTNPNRMYIGISAAGTFRSDDAGEHWRPANQGVAVSFQPEKWPEVGQCVHKIALDSADPRTIYRQDHDGIYVSRDAMDHWVRIGRPLPHDFGFVVTSPPSLPGNAFFVPLIPLPRIAIDGAIQVYKWSERGRRWSPTIRGRPWPGELGTHREGLASDSLDPAGVYLGTTTGELIYSADGAQHWSSVPYHFPAIHSVTVSGPDGGR